MERQRAARAAGVIEYADGRGPERLERILASSSHTMPPEVRSRLQGKLREMRGLPAEPEPALDKATPAGRREHAERLAAQIQAERLLEGE